MTRTAITATSVFFLAISAHAAGLQLFNGQVPQAVAESKAIGSVPAATPMRLAIGLPLRNPAELENLLSRLADPTSREYRQYLTPAQFAERFGPTEQDYATLAAFFAREGFSIAGTHPNRVILDISGTAEQIGRTFHVNMLYWNHPVRGKFFAPDREPSVDAGATILDISGLDNFVIPRPMNLEARPLSSAQPLATGSGPAGLYIGGDYRAAYAPSVTLNGAGQSVGLFELDGFYASDVQANFKQAGLTPVPVQTVLLDGVSGAPGSANVEVTLDIMMSAYMAPGLKSVIVYEGANPNDVLNRMATDNLASQLSSSWGWSPLSATTDQIFKQMASQGQSLFQASGDDGAYSGGVMPPADDPNLTVVGGTSLTTSGAGGAWLSETAWSGSGGGSSTVWPIPSYQQSVNLAAAGGSTTMRNLPDVAAVADIQIFLICNNGQAIEVGGTSAAAPLWAGFIALANQQAAASQKAPVGFLNPALYSLGAGSNYASDLHDIVSGTNGGFTALPGYDLVTGWGAPAGQALINGLTSTSNAPGFSLSASASTLTVAAGASGNATITINAQQSFSAPVSLTVSGLPAGVTASFSPSSATTSSTLTLIASNSAASSTSTLTITGTSGSLTSTIRLSLTISAPPSFTLSATPATLSIVRGGSGTSAIAVIALNGFAGTVTLAASGLPNGVTASFTPASAAQASTITLSATTLAATGAATVTVTGKSGSLQATASISLTVAAAPASGFTIAAAPASLSIVAGASAASTITITPVGGFSATVSLSASGLPAGVTAAFNPSSSTRTATVTFSAAASAAPGTSTITITGKSGSISSLASVSLTIIPPPSFTLSASPASLGIAPGASGTSTITMNPQNGFNAAVALTASGLPSGVTATFGAMSAAHTSVVTIKVPASAAAASVTVTITGTSGSLTSKVSIALTISAPPSFSLSASPTALSIAGGAAGTTTLTLTPLNGFSSPVTVTLAGVPAGVGASFGPGSTPTTCVLTLVVSASAAPGASTVTITGKSGSLSQSLAIALTVLAPAASGGSVNLASSYNVMGAVTDGAQFSSSIGLDGGGRSYSASLLGTVKTAGGASYNFGPANAPGSVSGATISLPSGKYSALTLLATGVNGNQVAQKFTVTYTDGSTASFTQSLSDWCNPQGYTGEYNAVPMAYRDLSNGTRDNRTVMLYGYTFNLSSSKTVKSITLPANRNVVVLAMDLASGTTSNAAQGTQAAQNATYMFGPQRDRR